MKLRRQAGFAAFLSAVVTALLVLPSVALAGEFKVARVLDGDTIKVRGAFGEISIRLVSIDAPGLQD